jgi:hypothetical protein
LDDEKTSTEAKVDGQQLLLLTKECGKLLQLTTTIP